MEVVIIMDGTLYECFMQSLFNIVRPKNFAQM